MSNVIIRRAVKSIRSRTSVYTLIVEAVVNTIQTVESTDRPDRIINIEIDRSPQGVLGNLKPEITGFTIIDNGEGFTAENREAFDTLYTERKLTEGGKGFGHFTFLKYFRECCYRKCF